jgi:antitoxin (DNA-binding transcriptional repressor) of toxin-antitoxin stability system
MKTLSISAVRNHLPSVINEMTDTNEPVVVERYGKPVARLIPFTAEKLDPTRYPLRGQPCSVTPDFDEPTSELWDALAVAERHDAYMTPAKPKSISKS